MINDLDATQLSSEDKLAILQRLDQFRNWRSLDDKRYCLYCRQLITGRQIKITGGTRGSDSLGLNCPTENCRSIPIDWVLPTDEMLAKLRERESPPATGGLDRLRAVASTDGSFTARLRTAALAFTLASKVWPGTP